MAARDELVAAIAGRYSQVDRTERGRILDEFTAITGFFTASTRCDCFGRVSPIGVLVLGLDAGPMTTLPGKH